MIQEKFPERGKKNQSPIRKQAADWHQLCNKVLA